VQEKFIGEVVDEFLREPGTDAAEEKRSGRSGREQHVTIQLPPGILHKLPKLQDKMQQLHASAVAMDPALAMHGSAPTECVVGEGSVLGLAGLIVTLQRMEVLSVGRGGDSGARVAMDHDAHQHRWLDEDLQTLEWFGKTQLHASFASQTLMVCFSS
jgi:hypothetical protein